jgi:hypothetical protein
LTRAFSAARLVACLVVCLSANPASAQLPARLSDKEFWALVENLSEPARAFGYLEGLASNEQLLRLRVSDLRRQRMPGVLIGVGPEQNFSYIAAARPRMAFIVDIRSVIRSLHLLYKALFELSKNRAEFLGRLFSRPPPTGSSVTELFDALMAGHVDPAKFDQTLALVRQALTERHQFSLSDADLQEIEQVLLAFYSEGPAINWWGEGLHAFTDFLRLNTMTDPSGSGVSFLGSEESFQFVKSMHARNLVIPIVGDFAGDKALRGIAEYVRLHKDEVSVFYGSNVDTFLQSDQLRVFCANLAGMPTNSRSVYIGGEGGKLVGFHKFPAALTTCSSLAR